MPGGDDRPSWATPTKHGRDGSRRVPSMPGAEEKPIVVTLNVRKNEKFFELKHEYAPLGTLYSMLQEKFIDLGRKELLSLQVCA